VKQTKSEKGTLKVSVAGVDGRGCKRDEHAEHLYNVQRLSVICKAQSIDRHAGGGSLTSWDLAGTFCQAFTARAGLRIGPAGNSGSGRVSARHRGCRAAGVVVMLGGVESELAVASIDCDTFCGNKIQPTGLPFRRFV
jgi:hypothetical protein